MKTIDWNHIDGYISNGLITKIKHPKHDLFILNYTNKVKLKKFWDDTTKICRGLIVDSNGNVIAKPFNKIDSYEDCNSNDVDIKQDYDIYIKYDGDLIILFSYNNEWIFATRNSFIGKEIDLSVEIFNANVNRYKLIDKSYTYLFELITPHNKKIVDYKNKSELILLTKINVSSWCEVYYFDMYKKYSNYFSVVERVKVDKLTSFEELKEANEKNLEGYVIRFFSGLRVKIKFDEYIETYGLLNNISNVKIWEYLKNNYDFTSLKNILNDNCYNKILNIVESIRNEYIKIENQTIKLFIQYYYYDGLNNRVEFARKAATHPYYLILYKIYNNEDYSKIIWNFVKPKNIKFLT